MRRTGCLEEPHGLGVHDHVCWVFETRASFAAAAAEFLTEGIAYGQQVAYVAQGDRGQLQRDLAPLGDVPGLLRSERLTITPVEEMYAAGETLVPEQQVDVFKRMAEDAVAAGFTGYRAAADITQFVLNAEQLEAFRRYEHLIDRTIAEYPLTGMCGYDRSAVGADCIEELAGLHPLSAGTEPPFRLFTAAPGSFGLSGEIDVATAAAFGRALNQLADQAGGRVVVDIRELSFVDHRALGALEEMARGADVSFTLRGANPMTRKVASWLGLERVQVELAA